MPSSNYSQDLRFLLPETVWLKPEHFSLAKQTSSLQMSQTSDSWQVYLNTLALVSLDAWLREHLPNKIITRHIDSIATAGNLKVEQYKFSAIAIENLLDEIVNIPSILIDKPELSAHFYVLLEVLEEEEEVLIRGFLSYHQLMGIKSNLDLFISEGCYQIPLSLFDIEPNHLLVYQRYVQSSAFALPVADNQVSQSTQASSHLSKFLDSTTTKLSNWLQGVIDESWQTINSLANPELSLAFSVRNLKIDTKRAKIIDLGMNLESKKVALLINISSEKSSHTKDDETQQKISVITQLYPMGEERFLPQNIKLVLLSKAGKVLQEVNSRIQDNYIQLKPFKGKVGKKFSIQISLGDTSIKENFEL